MRETVVEPLNVAFTRMYHRLMLLIAFFISLSHSEDMASTSRCKSNAIRDGLQYCFVARMRFVFFFFGKKHQFPISLIGVSLAHIDLAIRVDRLIACPVILYLCFP